MESENKMRAHLCPHLKENGKCSIAMNVHPKLDGADINIVNGQSVAFCNVKDDPDGWQKCNPPIISWLPDPKKQIRWIDGLSEG